jgi:hypothetical protein
MRARAVAAALLLAAAVRAAAAADEPPLPAGRPPEWCLAAGYGFSVRLNRGRSDEHLFLLEPGVSFRLGSRLEWVVEGHFARYLTPEGSMLGVMPLGLRFYAGSGPILPYVSIGAGAGWTGLVELDEIDRRFDFLLQGSLGVRGALGGGQAWTLEARLSHYSNAGTVKPNLGFNAVVFLAGARF